MKSHDREFAGMAGPPFIEDQVQIAWTILFQENDNKPISKWLIAEAPNQLEALRKLWESPAFLASWRETYSTLNVRVIPNSHYSGVIA